jgi:prevent-host-death family protein
MRHFGAFEAKTHFSELLKEVIKGENIVITKHGVEVALLVPFKAQEKPEHPVSEAIRTLKKLRQKQTLDGLSIREMREEGRK